MIEKQEAKRITLLIVFGWLVSLGLAVIALSVLHVVLAPFDVRQGLDLVKLIMIGVIFACLFGFVCGRSMAISKNENYSRLNVVVYYLGLGFIFGVFIIMCPRFLKKTIDFGLDYFDVVSVLIIGLIFGGTFARWSLRTMDQVQCGDS